MLEVTFIILLVITILVFMVSCFSCTSDKKTPKDRYTDLVVAVTMFLIILGTVLVFYKGGLL